ncbi:putative FAD linked oxidases, C-terminal domain [Lyophyllum shimeji]|uniref:D-lactate dehydrogenase (cytochrome) n=1 Tax=Lyophyllum shimeji TaxID=47721 RepID=A0A9P3PNT9_LYOSH|nr:putative FAD linked oxidases, C-terminal domain [Lyophyllum shimeji]
MSSFLRACAQLSRKSVRSVHTNSLITVCRGGLLGTGPTGAATGAAAARRRYLTTPSGDNAGTSPRSSTGKGSSRVLLLVLSSSIVSGLIGFKLASSPAGGLMSAETGAPEPPAFGTPSDFEHAIAELREAFSHDPDVVSTDPEDLRIHGFSDYDYRPGCLPSVVFYPNSTEDVVRMVNIATKYKMPVIPYSGATSLEGQIRSHTVGGICVDMSGMDRILEIHEEDSDLVCQPGAKWMDINDTLKEKGIPLFFPLDPGPGATIGGMLSTGCSGTNAVRYGTAKAEWFLNATVVLPSGEVIKTRRRSRKSSAGFDTTKLFIGAEGTLGIVTEVTIRLAPVLPTTVAVVQFPDVRKATEAVIEVMNQGVGIRKSSPPPHPASTSRDPYATPAECVELVDDRFMAATNKFGVSTRKWPVKDSLFFKFQGPSAASLKETAKVVKRIVEKHGGTGFELARSEKEAADLWQDRKNAHYAGMALLEGAKGYGTDVCVPVSKLPELVYETKKDMAQSGIVSTIVGHVGDGNFHAQLLFRNDEEYKKVREIVDRMVHRAIALDGTCTGEHGVGVGKKKYLVEELGAGTVELMKTIKRTIDPLGLFNPGKLYPDGRDDNDPGTGTRSAGKQA